MVSDFRAIFLPYCLQRQPDGRYAVLNRRYKPIGFTTREHLEYDKYPVLVRLKRFTPRLAAAISIKGSPDVDNVYLYDDGTSPVRSKANMAAYLARLEKLAKLNVEYQ